MLRSSFLEYVIALGVQMQEKSTKEAKTSREQLTEAHCCNSILDIVFAIHPLHEFKKNVRDGKLLMRIRELNE